MLLTEQAVRDNLRNRDGKRVYYLNEGDQLTSGARDFLRQQRVEILPAKEAKPEKFRLLSGGYVEEKPEHMTHLHGDVLVPKTHPRVKFRGKMDTFQAILILAQLNLPEGAEKLQQVLELSHRILRADVLEEPLPELPLCGMTEAELRQVSHFPQKTYGIPHFMPSKEEGIPGAWLNLARTAAREAELSAAEAFSDQEGNPTRTDILKALNRMSSMLYILMIEKKAGKL